MRASRLVALLLALQHTGAATAAELADAMEVSVRTIYRDIAALQAAGVPIWTETGPRGGIRLIDGWRTDLDGLTAEEATALFLGGAPSVADELQGEEQGDELGLGTVLTAAQTKVLSTLPPELRGRASRVRERFLLDAPGWFHHDVPTEHLPTVSEALWEERRLDVRYRRGDRTVTRRLDPLGLVLKAGVWYLVARHRTATRTYRVDRIATADLRSETFVRPTGFDLAGWWAASSADFDRSMLRAVVRIRVSPAGARWLPFLVDQRAAQEALDAAITDDDGWRTLDLRVESEDVALHQLTGLGAGIEVLDPPSLRTALAEVGAAMARRNAPTAAAPAVRGG
jgi:predicted DNA-binding transcriptional regulator YafY